MHASALYKLNILHPVTAVQRKMVRQSMMITKKSFTHLGTQDSSLWPQRPLAQRCWLCRAQICLPAAGTPASAMGGSRQERSVCCNWVLGQVLGQAKLKELVEQIFPK